MDFYHQQMKKPCYSNNIKERAYYMSLKGHFNNDTERYLEAEKREMLLLQLQNQVYNIQYDLEETDGVVFTNEESEDEYDEDDYIYCEICYEEYKKDEIKYNECEYCGMPYCGDCLKKYITIIGIKCINKPYKYDDFKMQCPDPDGCKEGFYIKNFISEEEYINIVKKYEFKLFYCIQADCKGKLNNNECEKCHNKVCLKCNQNSHEGNCKETDINELNNLFEHSGSDINQCPNCDITIFRDYGCDSCFCWNCSRKFDWNTNDIIAEFSFSDQNYYDIYCHNLTENGEGIRYEHYDSFIDEEYWLDCNI